MTDQERLFATIRLAMAIEGPWNPVPENSPFTLEELRSKRWYMLSKQKQNERMAQARAVLLELEKMDYVRA